MLPLLLDPSRSIGENAADLFTQERRPSVVDAIDAMIFYLAAAPSSGE